LTKKIKLYVKSSQYLYQLHRSHQCMWRLPFWNSRITLPKK